MGFIHDKLNTGRGEGLALLSSLKLELLFPLTWYFCYCYTLPPCASDGPFHVFLYGTNGTRFLNVCGEVLD